MKPLILTDPFKHLKKPEEEFLYKTILMCLDIDNIPYTLSVFSNYDLVHFINGKDLRKINDAKDEHLPVIVNAFYNENVRRSSCAHYKKEKISIKSKYIKSFLAADVILVPGLLSKKIIEKENINTKVIIFPHPINIDFFTQKNKLLETLFYNYFTERKDSKYILCIGDYSNKVEINNLLEIAMLCKNIKFYFLGANYHKKFHKYIEEATDNIVFSDFVESDVYASTLKNANALLVLDPRKQEAANVLEAMAAKTPVVSMNNIKQQTFLVDKENAILCNGTFSAAAVISKLIKNKNNKIVDNAFKYVQQFSIKNSANKLRKIYQEVLKGE